MSNPSSKILVDKVCPNCGNSVAVEITANSPQGYTYFDTPLGSPNYLCGCLTCGNVFLSPGVIKSFKEELEKDGICL